MKNFKSSSGGEWEEGEEETPFLEYLACRGILLLFGGILLILAVISVRASAAVYGGAERSRFYRDSPFFHLAVFAAVTWAGVMMRKYKVRIPITQIQFWRWVFIISGLFLIWIMVTLYGSTSDQRLVLDSGKALVRGDLSPWDQVAFQYSRPGPRGYAYTHPHQNGLILYAAVLYLLAGDGAVILWQTLNVAFLAAGMVYTGRLAREVFRLRTGYGLTLTLLCFLPFSFYVTFAYGTIPGFACSAMALWQEHVFLEQGGRKPAALAAVLIVAAILLKSNYLIVLIAMILFYLWDVIFRRQLSSLAAIAGTLFLYLAVSQAVPLGLQAAAGHPVKGGPPMTAWAAMGLQEGSRAPGWYNGYNLQVYIRSHEDREMAAARIEQDLLKAVRRFAEDPGYAGRFFLRKTESVWAEPTFQSLWIQEVKGRSWLFPSFSRSLYKEGGAANEVYYQFFDLIQSLIYEGAFLFVVFYFRKIRFEQLSFAVIFLGGFLFHLVWEGKGQYTVCYFVLLIPYAWMGLREWTGWVGGRWKTRVHLRESQRESRRKERRE